MTDLLPPNATATERAISKAIGPHVPGVDLLRGVTSPKETPSWLLPYLGWGEDLPAWPADEQGRRHAIQSSPKWHALIGTASGLRTGARLTGADAVRIEEPPAKTFLGFWDSASRQRWLDAMPQLRIFQQRRRASVEGLCVNDGYLGEYPAVTSAMARSMTQGEIVYPDGHAVPLVSQTWGTVETESAATVDLALRAVAVGIHLGDGLAGNIARADASARIWRVNRVQYLTRDYRLTIRRLLPGLKPVNPDAELVAERGLRDGLMCLGLPVHGPVVQGDAVDRIYRRVYLHDPDVAAQPKYGPAYIGFTRLSSPPFVAMARVRMPEQQMAGAGVGSAVGLSTADCNTAQRMAPTLDAMNWFRATHDKILIATRLHGYPRASRVYRAGSVMAGQISTWRN